MAIRRIILAAARAAAETRRDAGLCPDVPICPIDLAVGMGLEVRYCPFPSMEGMYARIPRPLILLPGMRPGGRTRYACGHELGHHVAGHGDRVDEVRDRAGTERSRDPIELYADSFSGFLLMPKKAVLSGLTARGLDPASLDARDAYRMASWLGVGYATFVHHARWNLDLLSPAQATRLHKETPKGIRKAILGRSDDGELIEVDEAWTERAVDLSVGDLVLAPEGCTIEGDCLVEEIAPLGHTVFRAVQPGKGRLVDPARGWAAFSRVSRKQYEGLARFRHLEEVADE